MSEGKVLGKCGLRGHSDIHVECTSVLRIDRVDPDPKNKKKVWRPTAII